MSFDERKLKRLKEQVKIAIHYQGIFPLIIENNKDDTFTYTISNVDNNLELVLIKYDKKAQMIFKGIADLSPEVIGNDIHLTNFSGLEENILQECKIK